MPNFETPARTALVLKYEGADISADVAPFLLSFEYTDKASGESDDIQITLEDTQGKWLSSWSPDKGAKIYAALEFYATGGRRVYTLPCGSFEIDEIEFSEPPMQITIKATAVPVSSSAVGQLKTKAWESFTLKRIASEIAKRNSLSLYYDATQNPTYVRKDQIKISDLAFLAGLCRDAGLDCKCTDEKIVIFDEAAYEEKTAICMIRRGDERIISASFRSKSTETYCRANVSYHDPLFDETQAASVTAEDAPDTGRTLEINQKVESLAEAQSLGAAHLRAANRKEVTGSITLTNLYSAVGGGVIEVSGWGTFDGRYFIESARHSFSGSGYQVELQLNESAKSKAEKKAKKKGRRKKSQKADYTSFFKE